MFQDSIIIESIYNGYCDQVIELIVAIQKNEFGLPITLNQQPDLLDVETHYHNGGGNFWGAFICGNLIGTIGLINCGHNAACIRKMFVKMEYRGKELGIAQQLLNTLMQYCKEKEITDLFLGTTHQLKAAHRFYERNSFTKIEVADLPAYFPRMITNNMFYQLQLNN
jgi:N-acetylglutamate synthase-like GNAT family acetyltransferase